MHEYCKYLQYGRRKGLRLKEASIFITHQINIDSLFPASCFHKAFFSWFYFLKTVDFELGQRTRVLRRWR